MQQFRKIQHPMMLGYEALIAYSFDDARGGKKEYIYPKEVYEELLYLGYTDYTSEGLKRTTSIIRSILTDFKEHEFVWSPKWTLFELPLTQDLDTPEMINYLYKEYMIIPIRVEEEKILMIISFNIEKMKKDTKINIDLNNLKPFIFRHRTSSAKKSSIDYPNKRKIG